MEEPQDFSEADAGLIRANIATIDKRIAAACARVGRAADSVQLLAVTKTRPIAALQVLHQAGYREFGENRVQDARERIPQLPSGITWHFIGHLQTNKAKYLPGLFSVVHSVDSIELAQALDKAMARRPDLPPMRVFLQVNVAGEEQKFGTGPDDARRLLEAALPLKRLQIEGLMTMAPYSESPEDARPTFRGLRELRDELQRITGTPLPQLSMGMTGDFEVAIEEGSTLVRIGTAIFE